MMPIMRPLDTSPTTRPRMASGARCAASGTKICTATEASPTAPIAARKAGAEVAIAASPSASALAATQRTTSRRFSNRSPSGTMKMSPTP